MLRRNRDRDEQMKAAQAKAAALSDERKRWEQQRAQLEAELAEAHRERCVLAGLHASFWNRWHPLDLYTMAACAAGIWQGLLLGTIKCRRSSKIVFD